MKLQRKIKFLSDNSNNINNKKDLCLRRTKQSFKKILRKCPFISALGEATQPPAHNMQHKYGGL